MIASPTVCGAKNLTLSFVPEEEFPNKYEYYYVILGKTSDGTIVLADEISPDTCRFWDIETGEKLDKDRFRRDMGGVEDAYNEVMRRVTGEGK